MNKGTTNKSDKEMYMTQHPASKSFEVKNMYDRYIWYAAYGSNICYERFMKYIHSCTDQTEPSDSRPITIPHNIYFAGKSSVWSRKGFAFLDNTAPGMCWGRMYLITFQQFKEIQTMEGKAYSKKICLGNVDGTPIYTFTAREKREDINAPSIEYIQTILTGLSEIYPEKAEIVLEVYLYSRGILNNDDYQVLNFIRNSAHGVSVCEIAKAAIPVTRAKKSVEKLRSYHMLKQDTRSVNAGHTIDKGDAVVYTVKEKRDLLDLLVLCSGSEEY